MDSGHENVQELRKWSMLWESCPVAGQEAQKLIKIGQNMTKSQLISSRTLKDTKNNPQLTFTLQTRVLSKSIAALTLVVL
jgi:hypothetical protein